MPFDGSPINLLVHLCNTNFCVWLKCCFLIPGQRVVVVRCEGINISGNFFRSKCKLLMYDVYLPKDLISNEKCENFQHTKCIFNVNIKKQQ